MPRFKDILARDSERSNLCNVGICVGAVLLLVIAAFVVAFTDFIAPKASDEIHGESTTNQIDP